MRVVDVVDHARASLARPEGLLDYTRKARGNMIAIVPRNNPKIFERLLSRILIPKEGRERSNGGRYYSQSLARNGNVSLRPLKIIQGGAS